VVEFRLSSERKAVLSSVGCNNDVLGQEAPYPNVHNFREGYGEVVLVMIQDLVGRKFFELPGFPCGDDAQKKRKPTDQKIRQPIQNEGRTPSPSQDEPLVCGNQEGLAMALPDIDEADDSLAHSCPAVLRLSLSYSQPRPLARRKKGCPVYRREGRLAPIGERKMEATVPPLGATGGLEVHYTRCRNKLPNPSQVEQQVRRRQSRPPLRGGQE